MSEQPLWALAGPRTAQAERCDGGGSSGTDERGADWGKWLKMLVWEAVPTRGKEEEELMVVVEEEEEESVVPVRLESKRGTSCED
jgi:hypothetical protein